MTENITETSPPDLDRSVAECPVYKLCTVYSRVVTRRQTIERLVPTTISDTNLCDFTFESCTTSLIVLRLA